MPSSKVGTTVLSKYALGGTASSACFTLGVVTAGCSSFSMIFSGVYWTKLLFSSYSVHKSDLNIYKKKIDFTCFIGFGGCGITAVSIGTLCLLKRLGQLVEKKCVKFKSCIIILAFLDYSTFFKWRIL